MRRSLGTAIGLAVLAAVIATPARAAAPWSAPVTISSDQREYDPRLTPVPGAEPRLSLAFTPSAGAPARLRTGPLSGPLRTVPGAVTYAPVGPLSLGRSAVARERSIGKERRRLSLDTVLPDGTVRSGRGLSDAAGFFVHDVATGPRGALAVGWTECATRDACDRLDQRLYVAVRRSDGWRRQAFTPAPGEGHEDSEMRLRFGRGGELLAAWTTDRVIFARTFRAGRWGRSQRLGPHRGFAALRVDAAAAGHFAVAWGSQDQGEEANDPFVVRAVIRRPAERRFGSVQLLDRGSARARPMGGLDLALDGDGRALVGWTQRTIPDHVEDPAASPAPNPVRLAAAGPDGRFGPARQLDPNAGLEDIAFAADGRALVTWSRSDQYPSTGLGVFAVVRPAGAAAFGPVETVSAAGAGDVDAGFDHRTGRPILLLDGRRLTDRGRFAPGRLATARRAASGPSLTRLLQGPILFRVRPLSETFSAPPYVMFARLSRNPRFPTRPFYGFAPAGDYAIGTRGALPDVSVFGPYCVQVIVDPGFTQVTDPLDRIRLGRSVMTTLRPSYPADDGTAKLGPASTRRPHLRLTDPALVRATRELRRIGCPRPPVRSWPYR